MDKEEAREAARLSRESRATRRRASPLLTQRSSVVCVSARSQILVPLRFCFVGCNGCVLPRSLRVWISTRCRKRSSSGCTRVWCKLASMDETVLAALVDQVLVDDELASSS